MTVTKNRIFSRRFPRRHSGPDRPLRLHPAGEEAGKVQPPPEEVVPTQEPPGQLLLPDELGAAEEGPADTGGGAGGG